MFMGQAKSFAEILEIERQLKRITRKIIVLYLSTSNRLLANIEKNIKLVELQANVLQQVGSGVQYNNVFTNYHKLYFYDFHIFRRGKATPNLSTPTCAKVSK
jgi:hypothetical protein